jgi:3-hydroxyisobutyrate dehydrogenase-like beta-hydroxyacid dehydrogenase
MRVTVFGLGEAGSLIAADLARSELDVLGYDPAAVPTPDGVARAEDPISAVDRTDLVLSITAAADAAGALGQAAEAIPEGTMYADLSTASPGLKDALAAEAESHGLRFTDIALMAPVPGKGLATPALASGMGAEECARIINEHGGAVEYLSDVPGDAAARKLLRSIVTKGLTSLLVESLRAAEEYQASDWLWSHLVETITDADGALLVRLLDGTPPHIDRRIDEMRTAEEFIQAVGVETSMTRGTIESLLSVKRVGLPPRPGQARIASS